MLGEIPNEIFPLINFATLANYDISQILVDERSSCYIIYVQFFTKLGMRKESLISYMGENL